MARVRYMFYFCIIYFSCNEKMENYWLSNGRVLGINYDSSLHCAVYQPATFALTQWKSKHLIFGQKKPEKARGEKQRSSLAWSVWFLLYACSFLFHSICKPAFMMPYKILSDILLLLLTDSPLSNSFRKSNSKWIQNDYGEPNYENANLNDLNFDEIFWVM